ncbi:RluA family pseudouridine synthase [[Mycoplasma] cavipharyngis]|uniref:RluA family pseudouridine synthase n=1 Tax=[Mycoplasma] cavipharyngis TaxID=92757 RepID=UPI00370400D5
MKQIKTKHLTWMEYRVKPDFINYRLDKLMKRLQPQWTKVFLYKMIQQKNILVNHKRTTINYHLKVNDLISYYGLASINETQSSNFSIEQLENLPQLDVIFEDQNLIIVNKPIKVPVQATTNHYYDNMNNRLLKHCHYNLISDQFKPVFVHRLDQNTTGLLIGAKNYQTYQQLIQLFKKQEIIKTYHALVWNQFSNSQQEIKNYLVKNVNNKKSYVVNQNFTNSKFAHSSVFLVKNFKQQALLKIIIHTGRYHQVRVHLSQINHPICGDRKYSVNHLNKLFMTPALIASELVFQPKKWSKELIALKNQTFKLNHFWFLDKKYIFE